MKFAQDIILTPVITERSMDLIRTQRKYTFKVARDANKIEIKKAVEELFKGVKVESVNVMNCSGKEKRQGYHTGFTSKYRKAIVTVTKDSKTIEFFDNLM